MSQQRADLEHLRSGLMAAFDEAPDTVKAQIASQLRAVVKDLAALGEVTPEVSAADEIAARREARVTGAGRAPSASRRSQPRRSG